MSDGYTAQSMIGMHYTKLRVWEKAMALAEDVYALTTSFPKEELYGISSQMRRAAVSVSSNIAEGSQRTSSKEFAHFLLISRGSLAELDSQLRLSFRLQYCSIDQMKKITEDIDQLFRMLHAFHSKLMSHVSSPLRSKLPPSSYGLRRAGVTRAS